MNTADPPAQLRDIHLPEPVSWWPPAPGWWIVALVTLAALILALYLVRRYLRRTRYRRLAIRELEILMAREKDNRALLEKISALLRRVAIHAYGRQEVAPLSGTAWLAFLDRTGKTDRFSRGEGKILGDAIYRASPEADMAGVRRAAEKWIRGHRQ